MFHLIDRRLNPKDKSLGNRQRFLRRARAQIKEAVNRSVGERKVADIAGGETVSIPAKGIAEPRLRHDAKGGRREGVLPGNKEFVTGDKVPKPSGGSGQGSGKEGAAEGSGEDGFEFALSREEFLELFFEDLELPDLVKTNLKEIYTEKWRQAGFTTSGSPSAIDVRQTMRNGLGRRLALRRPRLRELEELEAEIAELESQKPLSEADFERLATLMKQVEGLRRKRRAVPFIDPIDVRFRHRQPKPEPNTKAVMFCLMDVSGSMGEREKDLAKRFFILLYLFLQRRYEHIDIVFIRHTHEAQEVDEETFFHSRETGGTVVSTALDEMLKIVRARYPSKEWNIYAAQASDGENYSGDSERCV
ncbi:MAG: YeaH/YhbH family protein, partial [Rhodospirillales bacterium]|nr:YeaH/YhbH family protein [Rhodospirillales bacterium]